MSEDEKFTVGRITELNGTPKPGRDIPDAKIESGSNLPELTPTYDGKELPISAWKELVLLRQQIARLQKQNDIAVKALESLKRHPYSVVNETAIKALSDMRGVK